MEVTFSGMKTMYLQGVFFSGYIHGVLVRGFMLSAAVMVDIHVIIDHIG
jgi:hypothetical protein